MVQEGNKHLLESFSLPAEMTCQIIEDNVPQLTALAPALAAAAAHAATTTASLSSKSFH